MSEVLAVDLKKCVNCGACETACAERHEDRRPRLKVKDSVLLRGHKYGDIILPINCKQCGNPACSEVCKTEAIVRDGDTIYIDEEKCVGCGKCTKACPFNAIFMFEESSAPPVSNAERSIFSLIFRKEKDPKVARIKPKVKRVKKAYKCDRCRGYKNSACVDACFYKALSFVDANELPLIGKPEHLTLLKRYVIKLDAVT